MGHVIVAHQHNIHYNINMISQLTSLDKKTGTDLTGEVDFSNVLERSQLNFKMEKVPMHTPEGDEVSGKYLLRREDNHFVLGTCSDRYNIVDNEDMFAPFDETVKDAGAVYESAGIVNHGKTCWVSAKLPENFRAADNKDDKFEQRVVMIVYHDGMRRNSFLSYNNRIICNNMMASLTSASKDRGFGVRHSTTWEDNLTQARDAFSRSVGQIKEFQHIASKLYKVNMSDGQAKAFARSFFNDFRAPEAVKKANVFRSDRSKTMMSNRVDDLYGLFKEGMGNEGKTRYDMMNAVTEYLDHHAKSSKNPSARKFISNLGSGMQARAKRVAVEHLLVA